MYWNVRYQNEYGDYVFHKVIPFTTIGSNICQLIQWLLYKKMESSEENPSEWIYKVKSRTWSKYISIPLKMDTTVLNSGHGSPITQFVCQCHLLYKVIGSVEQCQLELRQELIGFIYFYFKVKPRTCLVDMKLNHVVVVDWGVNEPSQQKVSFNPLNDFKKNVPYRKGRFYFFSLAYFVNYYYKFLFTIFSY